MNKVPRSRLGPALLRALRQLAPIRPLFFLLFGRSYGALWDSFAISPGTAREAILATVGNDEQRFWKSGEDDAARYVIPLLKPESVVLDLGAGIGRVARAVAPYCARVILADASASMLRLARRALHDVANAELVQTSGRSLGSIPTGSVDVAYSLLVLQHIDREDVICYLAELRRVLRPQGIVRLQFPNLSDPRHLTTYVNYATATKSRSPGRMRYYTEAELEVLFPRLGFMIESIEAGESLFVTAHANPAMMES